MTNQPIQKIIFGSPGTGKSYMIKDKILPSLGINEKENPENVIKAVFHPEYTYGDFLGKLLPITKDKDVEYRFYEGHFLKALARAYKNILNVYDDKSNPKIDENGEVIKADNVVLVIDEINRGNSSAIFGSVFQLLDRENDGWSSYETTINGVMFDTLYKLIGGTSYKNSESEKYILAPYDKSGGVLLKTLNSKVKDILNFDLENKTIKIPPNLHIIATMNTSDNSIYHMDTAFKRRWEWEFIDVDEVHSKKIKEAGEGVAFQKPQEWIEFVGKLNQFIKSNHNYIRGIEDKQIGKYFIKTQDDKIGYAVIQSKLMFFIWDSVFNRDKKPLADLLGVSKDELVTFGDFALKVKAFIKAIQER